MILTLSNIWRGIAFAVPFCLLFTSQVRAQHFELEIVWENSMAAGIAFNLEGTSDSGTKTIQVEEITIRLKGSQTSMFGKIERKKNSYSFNPVIPFTSGLTYQIDSEDKIIHEFLVPFPENLDKSSVTSIFPSSEKIPANILKIHIYFSESMQEGRSKDYIHILSETGDTLQNVLLDLQPELWNEDQTGLTMWLDPGRIKRELQPNLTMGPPLMVGSKYHIVVSKEWKDKHGMELSNDFTKTYSVIDDDRTKPTIMAWEINYPPDKTRDALIIDFDKSMDYEVAMDAIYIIKNDKIIEGKTALIHEESQWRFYPTETWTQGKYEIVVESRLDDLAGNNLNRLFDRDLIGEQTEVSDNHHVTISFTLPQDDMP